MARLLAGYRPLAGIFDEMMDADGQVRPHWAPFLTMLASLGAEEINRRFAVADRYLHDSGVFYRVYEDPAGAERPWPLSHVPLIINPSEWDALKSGLIQRAKLLELVLADVYGAATHRARRPGAGRADRRQPGVSAAARRRGAARRRASAVLCGRCRARRRRPLVGAGRSHPGAVGRRLRAGEPARPAARHSGGLSRHQGRAAGGVLPGLPVGAVELQPPGRFARLPAHARADERDPTSSTPISRAISACCWSRARI